MTYRIEPLNLSHRSELAGFVEEFKAAGEDHIPAFLPDPSWTFEEIVRSFAKQERGEDLPEGWVPGSTRFLMQDERFLGLFNLRHWLTDGLREFGGHIGYSVRPSERRKGHGVRVLSAALQLARELGSDRALVTCEPTNLGSIGVITRCGGVLEDRTYCEAMGQEVLRYWIDVKEGP